jgi:U-box domain
MLSVGCGAMPCGVWHAHWHVRCAEHCLQKVTTFAPWHGCAGAPAESNAADQAEAAQHLSTNPDTNKFVCNRAISAEARAAATAAAAARPPEAAAPPQRTSQRTAADADAVMAMLLVSALLYVERSYLCKVPSSDNHCQPGSRSNPAHQSVCSRTDARMISSHPGVQAEEEGRAPAAAPSKAALKRARKKAAVAKAAAAAAPASRNSAGAFGADPAPGVDPTSAVSTPAASQHAPDPAGRDASPHAAAGSLAAAQSGMQQLRLANGEAATTNTAASHTLPEWMLCPLTKAVLVDPVLCTGDGQTYERSAITQWLAASDTSPVTGQPLTSREVLPNHALRSIIQAEQARALRAGRGLAIR